MLSGVYLLGIFQQCKKLNSVYVSTALSSNQCVVPLFGIHYLKKHDQFHYLLCNIWVTQAWVNKHTLAHNSQTQVKKTKGQEMKLSRDNHKAIGLSDNDQLQKCLQ